MLSHFKYGILLNSLRGSIRFKRPNYVMMTSRLMRGQLESNLTNIFYSADYFGGKVIIYLQVIHRTDFFTI